MTILLRLADGLFFQLFVVADDLFVFFLDGRLQVADNGFLTSYLILQLFHVFGPADLLTFKETDAAACQGVFPFYIFAGFLQHDRAIAVCQAPLHFRQ